jgi:hypothetical protein
MVADLMPATSPGETSIRSVLKPRRSPQRRYIRKQHFGPVLGLGAAGTGLDVEEGIVGVHGPREHAPELQVRHLALEVHQIGGHRVHRRLVALLHRHGQQVGGVGEAGLHAVDGLDHQFQPRPLPAQGLGPLRIIPDLGVLEFQPDLGQTLLLVFIVKDTP